VPAPCVVAIRGLTTRQATLTLDERGCARLAQAIAQAEDSGHELDPEIERLGRQLRGFLKVWDTTPVPQGD
jgi:hypothetical protein